MRKASFYNTSAGKPLSSLSAHGLRNDPSSSPPVPFNLTEFFPTCPKEMLTLKLLTMYY